MPRILTALSIVLAATATPAFAQEEPAEMQHEYQGDYVSVERDIGEENGVTSGTVSVETQSGYGGERTFERSYDAENQSASRSSQTTTNAGQSAASGIDAGCDGNGTCSYQRSATGPEGQSVEANRSLSQTETGYARSGGVTGPQGQSTATQGAVGYTAENGAERSSLRTGREGQTLASDGNVQCTGNACNRTASQMGPEGLGRKVDNDTRLGQFGGVVNTRNVTAPNGQTRTQSRAGRARRRPR
ncbi:MAG: hypothetical protein AAFZ11_03245 [Pseudomonadota bacterium]